MWPAEHFAQVARTLLGPKGGELAGGRLMVLGGPGDRVVAAPLLTAVPKDRRIDMVDRESLLVVSAALVQGASVHRRRFRADAPGRRRRRADHRPVRALRTSGSTRRGANTSGWCAARERSKQIRAGDPRLNNPVCHMTDLRASAVLAAARKAARRDRDRAHPRRRGSCLRPTTSSSAAARSSTTRDGAWPMSASATARSPSSATSATPTPARCSTPPASPSCRA